MLDFRRFHLILLNKCDCEIVGFAACYSLFLLALYIVFISGQSNKWWFIMIYMYEFDMTVLFIHEQLFIWLG